MKIIKEINVELNGLDIVELLEGGSLYDVDNQVWITLDDTDIVEKHVKNHLKTAEKEEEFLWVSNDHTIDDFFENSRI